MSVVVCGRALSLLALMVLAVLAAAPVGAAVGDVVKVGAGGYQISNQGPGGRPSVTANLKAPFPTNDWCTSLLWTKFSTNMYAHPLGVCAGANGMRVSYPGDNITGGRNAVMGGMGLPGDSFVIGHSTAAPFAEARADALSDWFVTAAFADGDKSMKLSFGHGSPFVYGLFAGGNPTLTFANPPAVWSGDAKSSILAVSVGKKQYAFFGPTGATWDGLGTAKLTCNTDGKPYFSAALLPDKKPETLALFTTYAYSHVTDTTMTWKYDEKTSMVSTTYAFTTKAYEGTQTGTVIALYPHQWTRTDATLIDGTYSSVRGPMRITTGERFTTRVPFPGVLPMLPDKGTYDKAVLLGYVRAELEKVPTAPLIDTYWEGKNFGRNAQLAGIADAAGDPASSQVFVRNVQSRLEQYLTPEHFKYNPTWGTLIGYPPSYGSDALVNDHHFHYGYFIRAAAEVARQDPAWAKDEQWGGMIKLLIRDCASPDRNDPLFPRLRNFDIYEGHSWANGPAGNPDGNDQESSSEAMNAWSGIVLWGAMTGDKEMRDLGIFLYTSEMEGINNYWFNVKGTNFPKFFDRPMASMIWGGKTTWETYFSGDPAWKHAINYMPFTAGSLYLGGDPAYVKKNHESLLAEKGAVKIGETADLQAMYQALYDAPAVVKTVDFQTCPVENGNTRANFYYWCHNLNAMGQVDASVTADTPMYAVFKKDTTRTYMAYNATAKPLTVTFSDGTVIQIEKAGFGVATGVAK